MRGTFEEQHASFVAAYEPNFVDPKYRLFVEEAMQLGSRALALWHLPGIGSRGRIATASIRLVQDDSETGAESGAQPGTLVRLEKHSRICLEKLAFISSASRTFSSH